MKWATQWDAELLDRRSVPWPLRTGEALDDPEDQRDVETLWGAAPLGPVQALMEAPPGDAPSVSALELVELREVLADAMESIPDDRLRWVARATFIERLGRRRLATQLGISKSTVHRLVDQARAHLQAELQDHPLVAERLRKP